MFNKKLIVERLILLTVLIGIVAIGGYFWGHVDITSLCAIRLKGHALGDKSSLRSAVWELRTQNPTSYSNICTNISTIIEGNCFDGDGHLSDDWISEKPGCFIKGSRTLYLKPSKANAELTNIRVRTLIHLGEVLGKIQ